MNGRILEIIKIRSNLTAFRSKGSFGCLLSYINILEDAIKIIIKKYFYYKMISIFIKILTVN